MGEHNHRTLVGTINSQLPHPILQGTADPIRMQSPPVGWGLGTPSFPTQAIRVHSYATFRIIYVEFSCSMSPEQLYLFGDRSFYNCVLCNHANKTGSNHSTFVTLPRTLLLCPLSCCCTPPTPLAPGTQALCPPFPSPISPCSP